MSGCPSAAAELARLSDALPQLLDILAGRCVLRMRACVLAFAAGRQATALHADARMAGCRVSNTDAVTCGLAAVLLGACALPTADEQPADEPANPAVLEAVAAGVGMGAFFASIAALRASPAFAAAAAAQALPRPLTRESAAAATAHSDAGSEDDSDGARLACPARAGYADVHAWQAATGSMSLCLLAGDGAEPVEASGVNPLDQGFTAWLPAFDARLRSVVSSSGVGLAAGAAKAPAAAAAQPVRQPDTVDGLQRCAWLRLAAASTAQPK